MKVFIENEAGSNQKNIYDEQSLVFIKTVVVSKNYPYPYGFVIDTVSGDGDNLDCFILTDRDLKTGEVIDVEPIGMFEQVEDGQSDPKILAVIKGQEITVTDDIKLKLSDFILHVFDHLPDKQVKIGNFLDKQKAIELLEKSQRK